jgi:hypothetical protein
MRAEKKGGPGRHWPRQRLHVSGRVAGLPTLGREERVRWMIQPWLETLDGECYQVDMWSSPPGSDEFILFATSGGIKI